MKFVVAVPLFLVVVVSGCGSQGPDSVPSDSGEEVEETTVPIDGVGSVVDGPVLRHPRPLSPDEEREGPAALIEGVVDVVDGCMFLIQEAPAPRVTVVWPALTQWDADLDHVVLSSGVVIPVGSGVSGGGGYRKVELLRTLLGDEIAGEAERCADTSTSETAVINNWSTAIDVVVLPTEPAKSILADNEPPRHAEDASSPDPIDAFEGFVVERRPPTQAEYDRIDDDGRGGVLDCEGNVTGAGTWDWGPVGPGDPTGRTSDDALRDTIAETNGVLPEPGWSELTFSEGSSTFVHSIVDDYWRALVEVGGDPSTGIWRQNEFYSCSPDDQ